MACDSSEPAAAPERPPLPPDAEHASEAARKHPSFAAYWHRGLAEMSRYELSQSRYGEVHEGEAVWIFVTEPFDAARQLKHEGRGDPAQVVQVLKLNAYRRFYTGVYPYTLMTSTFLPLTPGATLPLKLTFSAQEWCGQVFAQLNRRGDAFELQSFSYFEAEGDEARTVETLWLEDGLWSLLRRDPSRLPTGPLEVVPAMHHLRLRHHPVKAGAAQATLSNPQDGRRRYTLTYATGRRVSITFEADFPHGIVAFTEQPGGGLPTTRATRTQALMLPYWKKNGADDGAYRRALGLSF